MDLWTILAVIGLIPIVIFIGFIVILLVGNVIVMILELLGYVIPIVLMVIVMGIPMAITLHFAPPHIGLWSIPVAVGLGIWSVLIALWLVDNGFRALKNLFKSKPDYHPATNTNYHNDYRYQSYHETHGSHLRPYDQLSPKEQEKRDEIVSKAWNSREVQSTRDTINDFIDNFDINDYKK